MHKTYKIVRHFFNGTKKTLRKGVTLEEAQAHCNDPETNSKTCAKEINKKRTEKSGAWFDAFYEE